jgi:hypothetical protein
MDIWEIEWEGMDWIHLPLDREQWCEQGIEISLPYRAENIFNSWTTISLLALYSIELAVTADLIYR